MTLLPTRTLLACALAFLLALASHAQTPEAPFDDGDPGIWYVAAADARLGGPWGVAAEVQHRNHTLTGDLEQLLVRGSARYALPDRATVALGYAFVRSEAEGEADRPFDEHRVFQEAVLQQRVTRLALAHRFRYEQRFVEDLAFQTRYRYALTGTLPFGSTEPEPGGVFAVASSEVFLRGAGRDERPVFDRVRLYGGLGVHVTSALNLQAGYVEQVLEGSADGQFQLALRTAFVL